MNTQTMVSIIIISLSLLFYGMMSQYQKTIRTAFENGYQKNGEYSSKYGWEKVK